MNLMKWLNQANWLLVLGLVAWAAAVDAQPDPKGKIDPTKPIVVSKGLMSGDDVHNYAKQQLSPLGPSADSTKRMLIIEGIRDYIKARGTNFLVTLEYDNQKLVPIGANAVHIKEAIAANYGYPPKVEAYHGTFLLRTNQAVKLVKTKEGVKVEITADTIAGERGTLIINPKGTYIWKVNRDDPPEQWIQGKWRVAKSEEMAPAEGGAAIWLENVKQGRDFMVRTVREPDYETWIEFGEGRGRTSRIYGRRP